MEIIVGKRVVVRPAVVEDVHPVAMNMRESDRNELQDGSGASPFEALTHALARSRKCWTITIDDTPVAMFGSGPLPCSESGVAWYLATDRMDREGARDLRVLSPYFIKLMQEGYETICNLVDCRNGRSIKWLQSLGFVCEDVQVNPRSDVVFALMARTVNV